MKKSWMGLALALCLLCAACVPGSLRETPGPDEVQVWFLAGENSEKGPALHPESHPLPQEGAEGLLALLLAGPEEVGARSPFPLGTTLRSCREEDGLAIVDLSETYGGLSGVDLTLADGCIVLTLCELSHIDRVYLTVEGRPRPFRDQVFTAGDFLLDNGAGEDRERTVRLWFLRGETLAPEERTLSLRMGDRVEIAAVQALLEGPESGELESVCPQGTELLSLTAEGHRYTVDLSGSWLEGEGTSRGLLAITETLRELDPEGQPLEVDREG